MAVASVEEEAASVDLEVVAVAAAEQEGPGNYLNHASIELDRKEVYLDASIGSS